MKTKTNELSFAEDLILHCTNKRISSEQAQKAVRAICRYFGGQMIYIPVSGEQSAHEGAGSELAGVIADAVDGDIAPEIFERIKGIYGGMQIYIPMEKSAFKKIIAIEIYRRYGKDGTTMNSLAREYNMSFSQCYRLWRDGQRNREGKNMPFLPFLENF